LTQFPPIIGRGRKQAANPLMSVDTETPDPFGYLDRWW